MANGIPDLLNKIAGVSNPIALLVSDAQRILGFFAPPQWGIYQNGKPKIIADSVKELNFKGESLVSYYPQEAGAFQAYNKVNSPDDVRIQLTKGGSDTERAEFLASIRAASDSLDLFDILMPEGKLTDCNVFHFDYRRTSSNGVGLLTVDVWLIKIRTPIGTGPFANTKNPSGADAVSTGIVLPQVPTVAEVAGVLKNKAVSFVKSIF